MSDWEPYNYSSAFEEPYRIRNLTAYTRLPFPVVAVDIVAYLIFLGLFSLLFGWFFRWIGQFFEPMRIVLRFFLPYVMVVFMNRIRPDGKKVYFYLWGQFVFFVRIQLPKKVFFAGQTLTSEEKEEAIQFRERRN